MPEREHLAEDAPRHLGTRTKARKRALDILFEADLRGSDALGALADHVARSEPPVRPFTSEIVRGVCHRRAEIDALLASSATGGWTLERMPAVDRNLARIATWEILNGDVAAPVAVDEAVTLAKDLSTDESPAFLNALLDRVIANRGTETS